MSAAKATLSDDVRHRILPLWGYTFLNFPTSFSHHPHFYDHVNHDDATLRMVIYDGLDCTPKGSTTPKGVAILIYHYPG